MINKERHPVDIYVGQRLRQKRQELGISQEKLAEAVNLTFQQIQKYEKGYNRISCSKLFEFSNYLKININYFFDGFINKVISSSKIDYEFKIPENENVIMESSSSAYNERDEEINKEITILMDYYKKITNKDVRLHIVELARSLSKTS